MMQTKLKAIRPDSKHTQNPHLILIRLGPNCRSRNVSAQYTKP